MLGAILITIGLTVVGTVVAGGLILWATVYALTRRALGSW